jgi:hypothetical protein
MTAENINELEQQQLGEMTCKARSYEQCKRELRYCQKRSTKRSKRSIYEALKCMTERRKSEATSRALSSGGLKEAQALVDKYSGTGVLETDSKGDWAHTEKCVSDDYIGVCVNNLRDVKLQTKAFKIHYSKSGTHVVPDYLDEE